MAAVICLQSKNVLKKVLQPALINIRAISTSKKNRDTITADCIEQAPSVTETKSKNWVSYGFDTKSEENDRQAMHAAFFGGITLCLVIGGFFWAYMPDYKLRDWAQREAYLELRRRESLGLPLIDPNLIPVKKIDLPDDDELGDTPIII